MEKCKSYWNFLFRLIIFKRKVFMISFHGVPSSFLGSFRPTIAYSVGLVSLTIPLVENNDTSHPPKVLYRINEISTQNPFHGVGDYDCIAIKKIVSERYSFKPV